jgi:hypothetical protein
LKSDKFLVILGLDSEKKPHAARFDLGDEPAVRKAAGHKGFRIGHAKTQEAAQLAGKLIEGRIFDSGRGLVPFVTAAIYDQLLKLLEIEPPAPAAPAIASTHPAKASHAPTVHGSDAWANIKIGTVILCRDPQPGPDRSWWECTVAAISKDAKTLTVKWKNYPALKAFSVKRTAVAILHGNA